MPVAFLQSEPKSSLQVEIIKFGYYIWCTTNPRADLLLLLENNAASKSPLEGLTIIFPYTLKNIAIRSERLLDERFPLNNFKRGPYKRGTAGDTVDSYDGIRKVRILNGQHTLRTPAKSAEGETDWAVVDVSLVSPLQPSEKGGLFLTFDLIASDDPADLGTHGFSYAKNDLSINFSIRLFDRYLITQAVWCPAIDPETEIKAKVLYDPGSKYGGFDITVFVPSSYIDIKTFPDTELLGAYGYDFEGKPSQKFIRLIWRARLLGYGIHDTIGCGDRMILSGVFLNPSEVINQLSSVSKALQAKVDGVQRLSKELERHLKKADLFAIIALLISLIGLIPIIVDFDKIKQIFHKIFY